jgi:hypothetical protein
VILEVQEDAFFVACVANGVTGTFYLFNGFVKHGSEVIVFVASVAKSLYETSGRDFKVLLISAKFKVS